MRKALFTLVGLVVFVSFSFAQAPLPFGTVGLSQTQIAFSYAGEIWLVERQGGTARRLVNQPGKKSRPNFSPDGSMLAFSLELGGGAQTYVMPVAGGEAKQLTWHPKDTVPLGWTADGKEILLRSWRITDQITRLFTIPVAGGFETELPLPTGYGGAFSPDGKRLAYQPARVATTMWRNYRGGMTSPLWIATLADSQVEALPNDGSNNRNPMWIGDKIYFVSDRTFTANLFSFDTKTKSVSQLTKFEKYDISATAACDDAIVFVQDGKLHLLDLATKQTRVVPVTVNADDSETKPRKVKVARNVHNYNLAPNGAHAVFTARGEVLTVSDKGEVRNWTNSSGTAERNAVWSPDGNWLAYFSDESGEYQLHLRALNSTASGSELTATTNNGETRKINIEKSPSFYGEPVWSPDAKRLAFYDKRSNVWIVNRETNQVTRVDNSIHPEPDTLIAAWSPDSQWLAYEKNLPNRLKAVFLHSLAAGKSFPVTNSLYNAEAPAFDASGKYLYFLQSMNAGMRRAFGMASFTFRTLITKTVNVAVLSKDGVSPLAPKAQQNTAMSIDPEGITNRIVTLPLPPRDYAGLQAGKPGVVFVHETTSGSLPILHKLDVTNRRPEKFLEGVGAFAVSADGSKLLYESRGSYAIVATDAPPKPNDGKLDLAAFEVQINPRDEWRQIYNEAWRLMRDYFYDANHHGQNLTALKEHYAAYLPQLVRREDLSAVMQEMFSHLTVSHLGVGGGDIPQVGAPANTGLLGADYEVAQGRYRIKRILVGDNSSPLLTVPLAQPGIHVKAGDYLLAVDNQEIKAEENLYRYFVGKAGKPTQIKVASTLNGDNARTFTVVPLPGENTLRLFNWMEANRRKVAELSGGKLAYIYLPDTGRTGYDLFNRDFYAQLDKQGVIIDERSNSGGAPADYFIDLLKRQPLSSYTFREGVEMPFPVATIPGPRVMIINEDAGSGGDTLPWMFRQSGLGTLVGKRTWGGGIGGYINLPSLVDGGQMSAPNRGFFNPKKGTWDIENNGVAPDIEVEQAPAAVRAGRDPQLEKAVQIALEELKKTPAVAVKKPKYPIYK
jgi:tricorn protease